MFKERLLDNYRQKWHEAIGLSNKTLLEPEKYLSCITNRKYVTAFIITKFRCSNYDLNIETGRMQHIDVTERICAHWFKHIHSIDQST